MSKQPDSRPAHHAAYLDHAASSPLRPEAIAAMTQAFQLHGNASSVHAAGRAARRRLEESREHIADIVGALPSEVIFTSGGTESDNLALKGLYWARRSLDPQRTIIITTAVEHHAVLDPVGWLEKNHDAHVVYLSPDALGAVSTHALEDALLQWGDRVALVSIMWANNEVGTINPVDELAQVAAAFGVPFHVDACQAIGQLPVNFTQSAITALSFAAHKFGGPVGGGALVLSRNHTVMALQHGGGHERGLRSGTSDLVAITGMCAALEAATSHIDHATQRLTELRDTLIAGVRALVPDAILNGAPPGENRLPGNAHFSFPECEGDSLLLLLDAAGVSCSTGSACTAGVASASHVLLAMGVENNLARGSLRFSLGWNSTLEEIHAALAALPDATQRARYARPQY